MPEYWEWVVYRDDPELWHKIQQEIATIYEEFDPTKGHQLSTVDRLVQLFIARLVQLFRRFF